MKVGDSRSGDGCILFRGESSTARSLWAKSNYSLIGGHFHFARLLDPDKSTQKRTAAGAKEKGLCRSPRNWITAQKNGCGCRESIKAILLTVRLLVRRLASTARSTRAELFRISQRLHVSQVQRERNETFQCMENGLFLEIYLLRAPAAGKHRPHKSQNLNCNN